MNGTKLMLFGISLLLFGGFAAVGEHPGRIFHTVFYWMMVLGLVVSFVGLLTSDGNGQTDADSANDDGRSDRGDGDGDDTDDSEDAENENDEQYYRGSRFPPM